MQTTCGDEAQLVMTTGMIRMRVTAGISRYVYVFTTPLGGIRTTVRRHLDVYSPDPQARVRGGSITGAVS
jgi:hypothetical protein